MKLILPLLVGFWPVWEWYSRRLLDGSDEPWGVIALAACLYLVVRERRTAALPFGPVQIGAASVGVLFYLAAQGYPPLVRALIAVLSIGALFMGKIRADLALSGLLVLSLPIISSLEFFLGYPLRLVLTQAVAAILTYVCGLPVSASGTLLLWQNRIVAIDAPCSGVHMLWVGLFLATFLAGFMELRRRDVLRSVSFALRLVVAGNIFRATLLFYKESGIVPLPEWTHQGIGIAVFAVVALGITHKTKRIANAA